MTGEFNSKSQLAMLADALPVRARICLALFAADVAFRHLQTSPDFRLARDALIPVLNWHEGEPVDLDRLESMLDAEQTSLSFAVLRGKERSEREFRAWCVLGNAVDYVAYHAFQAANRTPWSSLSEIDESVLDSLDRDLRALEPSLMTLIARAAAYLEQDPDAPLSGVKAHLFKGGRTDHV